MKLYCAVFCLSFFLTLPARAAAQQPEVKFIADTLVVQAEGSYESDPDVALMNFDVMAQEKELKEAYAKATQSIRSIVAVGEKYGLAKDAISDRRSNRHTVL